MSLNSPCSRNLAIRRDSDGSLEPNTISGRSIRVLKKLVEKAFRESTILLVKYKSNPCEVKMQPSLRPSTVSFLAHCAIESSQLDEAAKEALYEQLDEQDVADAQWAVAAHCMMSVPEDSPERETLGETAYYRVVCESLKQRGTLPINEAGKTGK